MHQQQVYRDKATQNNNFDIFRARYPNNYVPCKYNKAAQGSTP